MTPTPTRTAGLGRRGTGLTAVLALALGGVVALAAPASADTSSVPTTLHGSGSLGSVTATASSGALSGSLTASASLDWSQAAAVAVSWNPDDVRQGRHLDPSDDYNRSASGTMSVTYSVSGTGSLDASSEGLGTLSIGFGPVSLTASGTCDLKTSGAAYTCHLESSSVDLFDLGSAALGTPYVHGKMVADVTVTPDQLATLRTASAGGQTLGTNALNLPEDAVVDPLLVGCKTGTGDSLSYALGDFSASPGLHVVSSVELSAGVIIPNPITAVPGIYVELASDTFPVATTNMGVTMAGPGGSVGMGAIKPNNIAPTLGAVSAPDGVEGSPIQFSTSATGPCAAGGTYTWDFGDGGNGHTATPQHTYADNGVYTGQVVFTDSTGLTDTEDFTVHVSNAAPNVTVVPGAPVTVAWGKPLTLKAQAVDPGAADQSTLTYDWDFADGDSIDNGGSSESHSWTTPGDRTPTVNVCDKDGACTLKTFTVHVRTHATTLAYTGPQAAAYSSTSTLTASLQDEFGTPINNAPVAFSVDGTVVGTALTNGSGHASLDHVVTETAGAHTVSAAYAGSSLYDGDTSATTPFTVSAMASTISYTGGLAGAPNKATAVSAKVLDALGRPLAGYPVTIVIGSQSMTATTNGSGVASGQIVLNQKPGYYPLTASWAGDAGKYLAASTSAQFSLNKK